MVLCVGTLRSSALFGRAVLFVSNDDPPLAPRRGAPKARAAVSVLMS
jgi:hypothetical protein